MRQHILLVALLLGGCAGLTAQEAAQEIADNPALAAGKYYAYRVPQSALTPAPAGYEPFYISAFARHGSRYLTKEKKYSRPIGILEEAEAHGMLTPDGQRALDIARALAREAAGRYGELTPKGASQHRGLVRRMFAHYPEVFADSARVDARSTYKTRAFLSMAAGCVELKGLNPGLRIAMDASGHDAYYIKYKNPAYERLHLGNMDSVYRAADSVYVHPARLMRQLFKEEDYVRQHVARPAELMCDLFELDGISQSSYGQQGLGFLFAADERYDLWQRNNFEWYYEKGPSPLSGTCMYRLERNLLENFIAAADSAIIAGQPAATLRYGHDTNLAPLAVLMGLNRLATPTEDWRRIADTYRTYRIIPMAGNVQVVFYRRLGGGKEDILVKVLLNEQEATLPLDSDTAPYYRWEEVRAYWQRTVDAIVLPPVTAADGGDD